jgi:hypothetical protein
VIKSRSALLIVLVVVGSVVAAAACSKQAEPPAAGVSAGPAAAPASPAAEPAGMAPGAAQGAVETISGEVAETMDAANYTYLRVKSAKGDVWVATAKTPVTVGEKVVVPLESEMRDFHSESLKRDFPVIYFVAGISRQGQQAPPPMAVAHGASGGMAPAPKPPVTVVPNAPPAGGSSIADVWANRTKLAGKTVTVRGTVVKFNGGILDRNWLHLQDGSGKAADGTNDITVTTDAVAKVGNVITVTGTVALDKDFTAGYAYPLMIEKAKIKL